MQTCFFVFQSAAVTTHTLPRRLLALTCACLVSGPGYLQAQSLYRIVGPDGQVTFTDKPPATSEAAASKVTPLDNTVPVAAPNGPPLPYELRQVVARYPVTLYSSSQCAPCDSGRKLLAARGVPFSEKTVSTAQDAEALQKLSGSNGVPFLTIGAQHVAGFSASEWTQYLNAAGYPESSKLPTNYRAAPATPMVAPEKPAAPAPDTAAPVAPPLLPAITAPAVSPDNPAGIRF